jgi:GNAT superfamily N-acetyltransferase
MADRYEIVPYDARFKRQVAELQVHLWGPDVAQNLRYLEWKYETNPYVDQPLLYLAFQGDTLVGTRGMFGARWQADSQDYEIPCAGDLVVLPEHRNRGLFTLIMKAAFEDLARRGYEYVFNLSAAPATHLASLAMGWRALGSLHGLSRDRFRLPLPAMIRRGGKLLGLGAAPFLMFDIRSRRRSRSGITASRDPKPEPMADLVARLGSDGRIRHRRDTAYFAWRYRNPKWTYRFLFSEQRDLSGYLVLGVETGQWYVKILDWEATSKTVRRNLLDAALAWGMFVHVSVWTVSESEETKALLGSAGFAKEAGPASLTAPQDTVLVRSVDPRKKPDDWALGNRRLLDAANWDLRQIYSDGS